MRIIDSIRELKSISKDPVLTIGNFDGVHLGHQEILSVAKKVAEESRIRSPFCTRKKHPVF